MQKGADYQFYKDNDAIDRVARALVAANGGKEPVWRPPAASSRRMQMPVPRPAGVEDGKAMLHLLDESAILRESRNEPHECPVRRGHGRCAVSG